MKAPLESLADGAVVIVLLCTGTAAFMLTILGVEWLSKYLGL